MMQLQRSSGKIERNTKVSGIEKNNVVAGIITDGDIRRLLIDKQFDVAETVLEICNTKFVHAFESANSKKLYLYFRIKLNSLILIKIYDWLIFSSRSSSCNSYLKVMRAHLHG